MRRRQRGGWGHRRGGRRRNGWWSWTAADAIGVRSRGEVGERRGGDFNVNRDFFLSVVVSNELLPPRSLRGGRAAGH
jgi:hypothetical protein